MAQLISDVTARGWDDLGAVASNFDHVWNDDIAARLMAAPNAAYAQYSGWEFCGYVWHDGEQFNCQIWRYRSIQEVVKADTGPELMEIVSRKYGHK